MNIEKFLEVLSDILSEKHGVTITMKAERREDERQQEILLAEAQA